MITLKPMTEASFEEFKKVSQEGFAKHLSSVEDVPFTEALKGAREQFARLVPSGRETQGQFFFDVIELITDQKIGRVWLGLQNRLGRDVLSINDISIIEERRGRGFGQRVMELIELEAKTWGVQRIRLHVFHDNEVARRLYARMGYQPSSLDMFKLVTDER